MRDQPGLPVAQHDAEAGEHLADPAAAAPLVAHRRPRRDRQRYAARRQQQLGRAPVGGLDCKPQRRLAEHAARHAHGHRQPGRMANRLAANHWPATAMAPTRLKAAEAPIRNRPAVTPASVSPIANSTHPPRTTSGSRSSAGADRSGRAAGRPGSACRHSRRSRRPTGGRARPAPTAKSRISSSTITLGATRSTQA